METKIGKEIIDIDDVSITNDGSKIEVKSTEKSVIIKCRNEEIEIMNKEGYSNFGDLFINDVKIEDKFSKLVKLNELLSKLKTTEAFYVDEIPKTNGTLAVNYTWPSYEYENEIENEEIIESSDGTITITNSDYTWQPSYNDKYIVSGGLPFHDDDDDDDIDGTAYFSNENENAWNNIHRTSYGSEYIYVDGAEAYVVSTYYVQNNKNNKLRLAKNSQKKTKMEPPLPGYKYRLIFSNFRNIEGAQFVVDGGVYTSEIFNGYYEAVVEINSYIEVYINSRTYLREGNQASLFETDGNLVCSMALEI